MDMCLESLDALARETACVALVHPWQFPKMKLPTPKFWNFLENMVRRRAARNDAQVDPEGESETQLSSFHVDHDEDVSMKNVNLVCTSLMLELCVVCR